jgi:hypothetical protein
VSTLKAALELDQAPDRIAAACRRTFAELDWEVRDDDGTQIVAEEEATRLSCRRLPARSRVRIEPRAGGGSSIEIETAVPGFGPISSSHARDRQMAVVRRIYAAVASETPSSSSSRATVSGVSR